MRLIVVIVVYLVPEFNFVFRSPLYLFRYVRYLGTLSSIVVSIFIKHNSPRSNIKNLIILNLIWKCILKS